MPKIGNKKKILIAFILFVVTVLFFSAISNRKDKDTQTTVTLPQVNFPQNTKDNLPAEIMDEVNIEIPERLNTYSYSFKTISENDANMIANSLEFKSLPTRINDVNEGNKLLWSDGKKSLIITPSFAHIKYSTVEFSPETAANQITKEEFMDRATSFMTSNFGFDNHEILAKKVSYLRKAGVTEGGFVDASYNNAHLIQVDLTYRQLDRLVLTDIPQHPILFVQFLPSGSVYRAEAYKLENISPSPTDFSTKNLRDLKSSLSQAKLINIEGDYLAVDKVNTGDINNIEIDNIELSYYYDKNSRSRVLNPVFLLSGKLSINNSPANYANLYLPALK